MKADTSLARNDSPIPSPTTSGELRRAATMVSGSEVLVTTSVKAPVSSLQTARSAAARSAAPADCCSSSRWATISLSWSGESVELAAIVTYAKRFKIPLIAMTSQRDSALGRQADIVMCMPTAQEACPNGLAPTTSTTMQLALGDALAMALLEAKGFTARDFRDLHPGGKLGAQLAFVRDIMHTGDAIPRIVVGASMGRAIVEMTSKGFGCVGVFFADGTLAGLITDGDLRRHLRLDLGLDTPVENVMTRQPRVIAPDALVAEALEALSHKISNLLVVEGGKVVGVVHFHDLLRRGAA